MSNFQKENIKDHKFAIIATITIFILMVVTLLFKSNSSEITSIWQNIILLLTAWILVWYTNETHLLRKESQLQNKLSVRPFIKLQYCGPGQVSYAEEKVFLIINEGLGPALNVNIQPVNISYQNIDYLIEFPLIESIKYGESAHAKIFQRDIIVHSEGFNTDLWFKRTLLDIRQTKIAYKVTIEFNDIFNVKRLAEFETDKDSKDGFKMILPQNEYE